MSSKRKDRDEYRCGGGKRPRRAPEKRKRHLYLMLDDCDKGYRMHKIDVDALDLDGFEDMRRRLPEPALLKFETPPIARCGGMCIFASGTSIFATQLDDDKTPAIVYGTDTGGLAVGPPLPSQLCGGGGPDVTMAVGDKMYALFAYSTYQPHPFEVMSREVTDPDTMEWTWTWKSVPSPPPYGRLDEIVSYAVHPDQRTFFISVEEAFCENGAKGTFSFGTKRCEWRWHGDWMLPFQGQGYYDAELDAWVGLRVTDGQVCACRVASRSSTAAAAPPEWKLLKEKLFCKDPPERQIPAVMPSLVYMQGSGGSSSNRFCLLECVLREGVGLRHAFGDAHGCLLRLTIFGLKYDHRGELQASIHRTNASYIVSKHHKLYSPKAFWM